MSPVVTIRRALLRGVWCAHAVPTCNACRRFRPPSGLVLPRLHPQAPPSVTWWPHMVHLRWTAAASPWLRCLRPQPARCVWFPVRRQTSSKASWPPMARTALQCVVSRRQTQPCALFTSPFGASHWRPVSSALCPALWMRWRKPRTAACWPPYGTPPPRSRAPHFLW